jgi:hypothetical protein
MAELYPELLIYMYHGTENQSFARKSLSHLIDSGQVVLFPLDESNLNADMYNSMFKERDFWETVNARHALVFQTDVHMCSDPTVDLAEFLKYDYVGAPFFNSMNGLNFMNGGLSLRNVDAMKRAVGRKGHHAEDVFFSHSKGLKHPTPEMASAFAVQTGKVEGTPVGVHKPWHNVSSVNPDLERVCPGVSGMVSRNGIKL